jgi:hypothetical protein
MLINAMQARELVEQSKDVLDKRLEKISDKIREAATLGKRELYLADVLYHDDWVNVEHQSYRTPEFTPVQRQIEKEMKRLGFVMGIAMREVKVGGGLGSMGEVKYENHPYLLIKW